MPFDTVGGLPPMPTQRLGTTLYQPRQARTFSQTRPARPRAAPEPVPVPTLPCTQVAAPHQQGEEEAGGTWLWEAEGRAELVALPPLPPVRTRTASPAVCEEDANLSHQTNAFADANPWRYRTTAAELEADQRFGIYGAAQFRPALVPDEASAAADAVTARKPLLQPYLYAQEVARSAAVETWQVRRNRYLQWLRKDAVKSLDSGHLAGSRGPQSVFLGTTMATLAGLPGGEEAPPAAAAAVAGGPTRGAEERRRQPGSTSPEHFPLPTALKKPSPPVGFSQHASSSSTWGAENSAPTTAANATITVTDGAPLWGSGNASAAAVRRLFLAARAAAAAATATSAGATAQGSSASDVSFSPSSASAFTADAVSPLRLPGARGAVQVAVIPVSLEVDGVVALASDAGGGHEKAAEADTGGPLAHGAARSFADELVTGDTTLALFGLGDSDSDGSDYASSGKSVVSPPSEYDLAGILRSRMHRTIALFSPSSQATLDEPPVAQTTHPVLGLARLAPGSATQSLLSPGPHALSGPSTAGPSSRSTPAPVHTEAPPSLYTSVNGGAGAGDDGGGLTRSMQRLFYEEAYDRGVLCQLAWQSSPTRWYSQQLPTGAEGIQYRLINAPAVKSDEAVRQRLQAAMQHAATTIALPRANHMAQQKAATKAVPRTRSHRPTGTASFAAHTATSSRCPSLPLVDLSTVDEARLTVECAAREKEALFEHWIELHVNVAAQLDLLHSEEAHRRKLLGEFVSCRYPLPCACLECDLEVLRMSAVPLEPTVKPLCLYTSIVLGRHRDILQREMLAQYQARLDLLHGAFRVGFRALYSYAKLVAEETRRFAQLIHYHEFCLVIAACAPEAERMSRSGNTQPPEALDTRVPSPTGSAEPVPPELQTLPNISLGAPATPRLRASLVQPRDEGMWRLRQRRLRYYAACDSPFFSYLVYTEMVTTASAEAAVRAALQCTEAEERAALKAHMWAEAAFARLREAEQRARASIDADRAEAHAAMLTGPVARLHAALVEERRAARAAAYERACEEARLRFVASAVAAKAVMEGEQLGWYRPYVRELRQRFLSQVVASRSGAESTAASRAWLWRQQHVSLFGSEQRLRDRVAITEEPAAFTALVTAAEASRRQAVSLAAHRERHEVARRQAEVQRAALEAAQAQERGTAVLAAQVRRAERIADPSKRPSACMDIDAANTFGKLATELEEDFEAFLPSLTQDA